MRQVGEPDVIFETHVLEIEYLAMQGELSTALDKIETLIERERDDSASGKRHGLCNNVEDP